MKKFLVAILLVFIIFGCSKFKKQSKETKGRSIPKYYTVKKGEISVKLEETGVIQPSKTVEIKSSVSGQVVKMFVEEGDFVTVGDTICILEPDFNQANQIYSIKSNLKLAEIRLKNANDDLEKKQDLFAKHYISQDELDNALDDLETAKINYQSALRQSELILDVDDNKNTYAVISDASGTVITKSVEEGEMVVSSSGSYNSGSVLVKLADLKNVVVKSSITEVDISKIHKNQKAKIQVDAYPHEEFFGKISKIAAMAYDQNGVVVFPIEINIDQVNEKLKPGMTANVTIEGETKRDIVVIPIRTIFSNSLGEDIVYKVVNDSLIEDVRIKTGINDFQKVEVLEGLSEGDKISFKEVKVNKRPPMGGKGRF